MFDNKSFASSLTRFKVFVRAQLIACKWKGIGRKKIYDKHSPYIIAFVVDLMFPAIIE